ncbi:hypothetical protein EC991_009615 [Linnemannia zychae]|nr:hypothetical protein EC991_009615 [Linnemannia zychae]
MGADWYTFFSITAVAIPVPKEALQKPFDLQGFKLITIHHEHEDYKLRKSYNEYHGAMICLEDTDMCTSSIEVIGPNEIRRHRAVCTRMKHLDTLMSADIRDSLISAFEAYTGDKPDVVPGLWTLNSTNPTFVELHKTWTLKAQEKIASGDCIEFFFSMQ